MRNRFGISPFLLGMTMLFEADSGGGSGGNDDPPAPRNAPSEVINRYGNDTIRMAEKVSELERDNYKLREQRRSLQAENETFKGKVPGEGALVLSKEQVKLWDEYNAFGKPEEVKTALESGKSAIAERDGFTRTATIDSAAKAAHFKPGLLKMLGRDLNIEVRETELQKEDGTTEKRPAAFVKLKDSAGVESETPLRDYFKAQGDDVLASLEAGEVNQNGAAPQGGTPFPAQAAGGAPNQNYKPTNRYAHHLKTD